MAEMTRDEQLISLVLSNRTDEATAVLESGAYDERLLEDIAQGRFTRPLPLYMLTMINDVWFSSGKWAGFYIPTVERNRREIARMKRYWGQRYGYPVGEVPDLSIYEDEVPYFGKDWSLKDSLDADMDTLIGKGYDRDEVELCYAALVYDKPTIDKHIAKGTNPNVYICGGFPPDWAQDHPDAGYSAISACEDPIFDVQICDGTDIFWELPRDGKIRPFTWEQIRGLIRGAAYMQLRDRLEGRGKG